MKKEKLDHLKLKRSVISLLSDPELLIIKGQGALNLDQAQINSYTCTQIETGCAPDQTDPVPLHHGSKKAEAGG